MMYSVIISTVEAFRASNRKKMITRRELVSKGVIDEETQENVKITRFELRSTNEKNIQEVFYHGRTHY